MKNKRRHRFSPADSFANEGLESRVVLSAISLHHHHTSAHVAVRSAHSVSTATTLTIQSGTLGQPIQLNVLVRAAAAQGSPQGTVNLVDHGQVVQTLTLSPTTSTSPAYAYSAASVTLATQAGGPAPYWFGRHTITAEFIPAGTLSKSSVTKNFTVTQPTYTTLSNGVKIATIATGSGPTIQSGQTAQVLYTGYLSKDGTVFDNSLSHGGTPLAFTLGAGQLIPGFDAGTVGMQVGESRIIEIPPAQGYGQTANGAIPANSTLIFVVTLQSMA